MEFSHEDNGNCRVYFKNNKLLYCWQDDGADGKEFNFYRCSSDGEPSYEVGGGLGVCPS